MEYDDFISYFTKISSAEIDDNASYVYESYFDPNCEGAYFTISIVHDGVYCLQVDKTPERKYTG